MLRPRRQKPGLAADHEKIGEIHESARSVRRVASGHDQPGCEQSVLRGNRRGVETRSESCGLGRARRRSLLGSRKMSLQKAGTLTKSLWMRDDDGMVERSIPRADREGS